MNTKNAFSTLLAVLITAVIVGVLVGVISYSYAASKKDLEIEDLREQLNQIKEEETSVEPGGMSLDTSGTDNQQPTTKTPSTATTDETANWKTYANEKYGFSFKYPDNFKVQQESNNVNVIEFISNEVINKRNSQPSYSTYVPPSEISIEIRSKSKSIEQIKNLDLDGKEKILLDFITNQDTTQKSEIITVGNKSFWKGSLPGLYDGINYVAPIGDFVLDIFVNSDFEKTAIANQILSTFQFTKKSF